MSGRLGSNQRALTPKASVTTNWTTPCFVSLLLHTHCMGLIWETCPEWDLNPQPFHFQWNVPPIELSVLDPPPSYIFSPSPPFLPLPFPLYREEGGERSPKKGVSGENIYHDARLHPDNLPSSAKDLNFKWDTPNLRTTPLVRPDSLQIFLISLMWVEGAGTAVLRLSGKILLWDRAFNITLSDSNSFHINLLL